MDMSFKMIHRNEVFSEFESKLAVRHTTRSEPINPGPCVTPDGVDIGDESPACASAFAKRQEQSAADVRAKQAQARRRRTCDECPICEATTLDKISRPSATTAAAVSSHEDSIPRMRVDMV